MVSKRLMALMCFVCALSLAGTASADLILHWALDDGAGNVAADSSGNGRDGDIGGTPNWVEGVIRGALDLDGSTNYIDYNEEIVAGTCSIALWLMPRDMPYTTGYRAILHDEQWTGGSVHGHLRANTSLFNFDINGGGAVTSTTEAESDEWYHLAGTFDLEADVSRIYVNGVMEAEASGISAALFVGPLNFGAWTDNQRFFPGTMDDIRVYDHALTADEIPVVMLGDAAPERASNPVPASETTDVPRDTVLTWQAGEFAVTHDVYLGTVFDDVNEASRSNPMDMLVSQSQSGTSYTPPTVLEFGQTYYWRIDEVNGAPDNTIFKGEVWSLTVEPMAYPVENVIATSNGTSDPGVGPENTVNGSGLNENDEHSAASDDMWLASPAADGTLSIQYEFPSVLKVHQMLVWNYNVQFELILGFGFKDVTVEYSEDGENWTALGDVQFAQATAMPGYAANTTIDFGGVAAKYVRLTVINGFGMMGRYGLSEIRFLYIPVNAREPQPADGATDVSIDESLAWRAGREAVSHEVNLGTDADALTQVGTVTTSGYTPDDLQLATTYYWQIAEVNEAATPSMWAGSVWSFTTEEFVVVDDFESYGDDEGERIYESWEDGWVNETGSTVGYLEAPFAEQEMIRSGAQSMPLFYDNAGGVSEADLALAGDDWTRAGITTLTLFFRGETDNTGGQLYVKINGVKVAYQGSANALSEIRWQQWNVDLASVGTNLGNITGLTIGIEGNGAGKIYVDDIRLYSEAPAVATPVDPGAEGLLLEYTFDSDASDSSGNGYNGTLVGDARVQNGVLSLDGIRDAVSVPRIGGADATFSAFTVSMWVYPTADLTTLEFSGGMNTDVWAAGAMHFKFHNGALNVGINGLTGGDLEGASMGVTNTWNHIAVTVSETEVAIYLNGGLEDSRVLDAPLAMVLGASSLGAWNNGGTLSREMAGQMDNVLVFDRALSAGEVLFLSDQQ